MLFSQSEPIRRRKPGFEALTAISSPNANSLIAMRRQSSARPSWRMDFALALAATLLVLACSGFSGFPSLSEPNGDNDSLLRLVEVRDLMSGQGWFDLHQYRMGPEGGFVMHWSRLVDAPIAGIILLGRALGASADAAEKAAAIVWPALLFSLTVFFIMRAARRFGGEAAALPALVLGGAALHFTGIFRPGAFDHHNIQLMLTMAGLSFLLAAPQRRGAALAAGAAIALSLAIGMETAPYVAAIGLGVAGLFAFGGEGERPVAREFGLGFAGVSTIVFLATVSPSDWGAPACDAFSVAQCALAALCGAGLAAIASSGTATSTRTRRVAALLLLGAAAAAVTHRFFPQCLAAPYAEIDPRLRTLWLDHVDEAQSLLQLLGDSPASVAARYVTPLLALGLLGARFYHGSRRREDWLILAVLAAAFAVGVWQVRGTNFAIAFAVVPLAAWVAIWREKAMTGRSAGAQARMALAWIVSLNVSWMGMAAAASVAADDVTKPGQETADKPRTGDRCDTAADFLRIAGLPKTTVLAVSNLGAPILAYSPHRALAGPYHRNIAGNLAVLDAFTGPMEAAEKLVRSHHVGLIAICHADAEQKLLAGKAPAGLLAKLLQGEIPAWLEPVPASGDSLRLYRVR